MMISRLVSGSMPGITSSHERCLPPAAASPEPRRTTLRTARRRTRSRRSLLARPRWSLAHRRTSDGTKASVPARTFHQTAPAGGQGGLRENSLPSRLWIRGSFPIREGSRGDSLRHRSSRPTCHPSRAPVLRSTRRTDRPRISAIRSPFRGLPSGRAALGDRFRPRMTLPPLRSMVRPVHRSAVRRQASEPRRAMTGFHRRRKSTRG